MIKFDLATQLLAFWGAILSTILAVVKVMQFYYEGVRIKVKVMGNMTVHPPSTAYGDKPHIIIAASNGSKRPTVITHAWLRAPKNINLLSADCIHKGPQRLQEGDYTQYLIREQQVQEKGLIPRDYVAAVCDVTGRTFYSHALLIRWFKIVRMKLLTRKKI